MAVLAAVSFTTPLYADARGFRAAPHSATYTIRLLENRIGDIASVDGYMRIAVTASCGFYRLESELLMQMVGMGEGSSVLKVTSEAEEAVTGQDYRFSTDVFLNDTLTETTRGVAKLDAEHGGTATFERPEPQTITLPPGTMFPFTNLNRLIQAFFEDDAQLDNYISFDGSHTGVDRGTDLKAGDANSIAEDLTDPDGLLVEAPKRIVTTLYDFSQKDAEPRSTIIADLTSNGITTWMSLDLGFIVLEAKLQDVTATPLPDTCS